MSKPKSRQQRRAQERDRRERLHSRPQPSSQRPLLLAAVGVLGVIAVIAALVVVRLTQGGTSAAPAKPSGRAPAPVVRAVTTVPASLYNLIGYQSALTPLKRIHGKPLQKGGKPLIVYVGAEYCPLCAAERWALVAALSRFGTFHNLGATHSSSIDVDPNTPTFSFHGATYTGRYLSLDTVELTTNRPQGNFYAPLEKPTALEQQLSAKYDPNAIPFAYLGSRYIVDTVAFNPAILAGMTMQQVAAAMRNPSSPICQAILGTANDLTAALCQQTNGKPASVCSSSGVVAAAKHLPA
ncbi:MAG: DUF929 family protein [Gaiellales bacterium]